MCQWQLTLHYGRPAQITAMLLFTLILFLFIILVCTDILTSSQCTYYECLFVYVCVCLSLSFCVFSVDWSDRLLGAHWELRASGSCQDRLNGRNLHENSDKGVRFSVSVLLSH